MTSQPDPPAPNPALPRAPAAAKAQAPLTSIDALQPEARFALRGLAAGLAPEDLADVLRDEDGRRVLRRVVRFAGGPPLLATHGDDALNAALAPLLDLAKKPPTRTPGTQCPAPDILSALALGRLDGPLMLAEAEHVADCPHCMAALVAVRRSPRPADAAPSPAPVRRGLDLPLVLGVLFGLGVTFWWLFLS